LSGQIVGGGTESARPNDEINPIHCYPKNIDHIIEFVFNGSVKPYCNT
jgi:hypothetical protein